MASDTKKEIQPTDGLSLFRRIITLLAILAWISIFIGGILINSEPYRQDISNYNFTTSSNANHITSSELTTPDFFIALTIC